MHVGCWHVSGRNMLFPVSEQREKQVKFRRNISAANSCSTSPLCWIKSDITNIFTVAFRSQGVNSLLVICVGKIILIPAHAPS